MSAESAIRDLRRENVRLLQRVNLLEKQLKAEQVTEQFKDGERK